MLSNSISVVDDQILAPTWTKDLSNEIIKIINEKRPFGTYHLASSGKQPGLILQRKYLK